MSAIRQQIVDAIEARLNSIAPGKVFNLPDGPYTCQTGIKGVYPWRRVTYSTAQIPAITIRDTDSGVKPGPSTQHEHALAFDLEAFVAGNTCAGVVRGIMQDIIAAVGSDPKWGDLARWTDIDSHDMNVDQVGDIVCGALVKITVTYRTPLWRI